MPRDAWTTPERTPDSHLPLPRAVFWVIMRCTNRPDAGVHGDLWHRQWCVRPVRPPAPIRVIGGDRHLSFVHYRLRPFALVARRVEHKKIKCAAVPRHVSACGRSRWFARPGQSPLMSRPIYGDSLECRMSRPIWADRADAMCAAAEPTHCPPVTPRAIPACPARPRSTRAA